jgi:hypothetical protein
MSITTVTIPEKVWRTMVDKINFIEQTIKPLARNYKQPKWLNEDEVIEMTGLSKRSLRDKRAKGIFNWSTATGRKIKYLRVDIENYFDKNSTLIQ